MRRFWRENWGFVVCIVVAALLIGAIVMTVRSAFMVYQEELVIKDTIKKTAGFETRIVEYFIYTDKGYFTLGGPVDADGTPYAWKLAKEMVGEKVTVKYYGWRVDGWMWYPNIFEVHR